jgi:cardiolipin synthase (CMP-forming)
MVDSARPEEPREADELPNRLLTIPNLLSIVRLALVPVFLWLLLGPHADGWALLILVYAGISDWADGKIARLFNQTSRLGALLDPAADRLYTLATVVAFVVRDIVPWWVAALLILRDVVVACCIWVLARFGFAPPEVTYIGKAATFNLLYAMPLMLLAQGGSTAATLARPVAYGFAIWGGALFLWSGVLYLVQTRMALRSSARPVSL